MIVFCIFCFAAQGPVFSFLGAKTTLNEFGKLLLCATQANDNLPPISAAWDGGGANMLLNGVFLGLTPMDFMAEVDFFKSCTKKKISIPYWPYKALFFENSKYISGCNDSNHVFKRYAFHVTSGVRMVRMGAFMVQLTPMACCGLSARALGGDDLQSDRDMARKMNAGYVPDSWAGRGIIFCQFLNALMASFWNACDAFPRQDNT